MIRIRDISYSEADAVGVGYNRQPRSFEVVVLSSLNARSGVSVVAAECCLFGIILFRSQGGCLTRASAV